MERASVQQPWWFWIDTGGTFTDCLARDPHGNFRRGKVLSSAALRVRVSRAVNGNSLALAGWPAALPDNFFAGYRLNQPSGDHSRAVMIAASRAVSGEISLTAPLPFAAAPGDLLEIRSPEEAPVFAMRLLTVTLLDHRLPDAALRLATTRGTNALLEEKGAPVVFFVTHGFADLLRIGNQQRPDLFALRVQVPPPLHGPVVEVSGRLDAAGQTIEPLEMEALRREAERHFRAGLRVAAVALLHSYKNPVHEQAVAACLREIGYTHVSVSSELAPVIKMVPRAETAVVDAYLSPIMDRYLDGVTRAVRREQFWVMTSAGGLVSRSAYRPKDSLLSGPAGGVIGAAAAGVRAGLRRLIGFDMGGTSADVARFDGDYDYTYSHRVGRARVVAPALKIESVAAGGGSICRFDGKALTVGPDSAGAAPGPACYGAGGPLTLTDVHLLLGRLSPDKFGLPIFPDEAASRLAELRRAITAAGQELPCDEILRGFIDIANERMAGAIQKISVREGHDVSAYALVAFGGAGGLHACGVAERLGITTILFPADSGLLSAAGLRNAVIERFAERQVLRLWEEMVPCINALVDELRGSLFRELAEEGVPEAEAEIRSVSVELRFLGQESALAVPYRDAAAVPADFRAAFEEQFGYVPENRRLELVAIRLVGSARGIIAGAEAFPDAGVAINAPRAAAVDRATLRTDERWRGPFVIQDAFSTFWVADGWVASVGSGGSVRVDRGGAVPGDMAGPSESAIVRLELFTNRFRNVVDEMGLRLQRTALSVNVKERLDFSCGLLDADGELVANAPHIPVHLGALGQCARAVARRLPLEPGDVAVTNHPAFGGSHLPDVTVIAPVHAADGALLGYVANRAHHAEIGGMRPGSMPPDARSLAEEGVVIPPMFLARRGRADWPAVAALLRGGPFPSRRVDENLADLGAQLASVQQGVRALQALAVAESAATVRHYMAGLKQRSAALVASRLAALDFEAATAIERLDDGTPIRAALRFAGGRLSVDFTGSGTVHSGNLNATPAIVQSAVIYVLRLLVDTDVPLNEGLMQRVDIVLPRGILNPPFPDDPAACPAVVGGNVETSQRIVDTLLKALGVAACSQGTMNNLIFGNARCSYYETIGGGTGATAAGAGADGVHSHMTNTAITDPEVLEFRFPVRLECFSIRGGSGGAGRWRGGDGLIRRLRFLEPVEVSLLAQHRAGGPYGVCGGGNGTAGRQRIIVADGSERTLAGIASAELAAGDILEVETPGGGAWGEVDA